MRRENWDVELLDWADARYGKLFRWGQNDCAMLCGEAHDVITGSTLAATWRGRCDSEASAKRLLVEEGTDLCAILVAAGCEDVAANFQTIGDFILVEQNGWWRGHVCLGARSLTSAPEQGVCVVQTAALVALAGVRILRAG